jgi:hypothetical protein
MNGLERGLRHRFPFRNDETRGSALRVILAFSEVGTLLAPARILVRGAIMIRFGGPRAPTEED